jgi:hypothetical protein
MKPMKPVSALFLGSIFGLLSASPAEANFHKTLQEVAGNPGRSAECAKGDTKVVRKIARETVEHGKAKFKISSNLFDAADVKRAEKEMYDFLNWKIGSPSAVCAQYITGGQKHFDKGYSDEGAAALMGLELPGAGRSQFRLPQQISDLLKAQIKNCADQIVGKGNGKGSDSPKGLSTICKEQADQLKAKLEKEQGIPPELQDMALKQVASAAVAGAKAGAKAVDRIGFNMPKSWDVQNNLVRTLIQKRLEIKAGKR